MERTLFGDLFAGWDGLPLAIVIVAVLLGFMVFIVRMGRPSSRRTRLPASTQSTHDVLEDHPASSCNGRRLLKGRRHHVPLPATNSVEAADQAAATETAEVPVVQAVEEEPVVAISEVLPTQQIEEPRCEVNEDEEENNDTTENAAGEQQTDEEDEEPTAEHSESAEQEVQSKPVEVIAEGEKARRRSVRRSIMAQQEQEKVKDKQLATTCAEDKRSSANIFSPTVRRTARRTIAPDRFSPGGKMLPSTPGRGGARAVVAN